MLNKLLIVNIYIENSNQSLILKVLIDFEASANFIFNIILQYIYSKFTDLTLLRINNINNKTIVSTCSHSVYKFKVII